MAARSSLARATVANAASALAAASVSDPLPSAPSVSTFAFTFAAIAPMPSAFEGSHTTSDGSASEMK